MEHISNMAPLMTVSFIYWPYSLVCLSQKVLLHWIYVSIRNQNSLHVHNCVHISFSKLSLGERHQATPNFVGINQNGSSNKCSVYILSIEGFASFDLKYGPSNNRCFIHILSIFISLSFSEGFASQKYSSHQNTLSCTHLLCASPFKNQAFKNYKDIKISPQ